MDPQMKISTKDLGLDLSVRPQQFSPSEPFSPGLHLLSGKRSSGKTVNSIALGYSLRRRGHVAIYKPFMEPRGLMLTDPKTEEEIHGGSTAPGDDYAITVSYSTWLNAQLLLAQAIALPDQVPVYILDGLTYTIRSLPETRDMIEKEPGPTFSGGLDMASIYGCMHHNARATLARVALVATVNSELMPTVEKLVGAVEGVSTSFGVGKLESASRETARRWSSNELTGEDQWAALVYAGYIKDEPGWDRSSFVSASHFTYDRPEFTYAGSGV